MINAASTFDCTTTRVRRHASSLAILSFIALPLTDVHATTIDARSAPIEQVTVYPGAAVIQRSVTVAPGSHVLVLDCLPPGFDPSLLRIDADAGVVVGLLDTESRARAGAVECGSPLNARIRTLEDHLAALDAESGSQDLVLSYLKGLGADGATASGRGTGTPSSAGGLRATIDAIQHAGQTALSAKHRLANEQEALRRDVLLPRSERDRLTPPDGKVVRLQIKLSAMQGGMLRLRYQVAGATWSPSYRARLDTTGGVVTIDRMAEVAQSSGEDWSGVRLRLSTGSPTSSPGGPTPMSWRVAAASPAERMSMPAPPAAMAARSMKSDEAPPVGEPASPFAIQMLQSGFATEFVVPGKVDIATASQRVALTLDTVRMPATVKVRTSPQQSQTAWLIAEVDRLEGVWPDGPMRLQRDEQIVGQSVWSQGSQARVTIPFGRDELVRVQANPSLQRDGTTGFIGVRSEERIAHVYEIENRHAGPIAVEVLEASPISLDEQIKVVTQFQPTPLPGAWMDQPGLIAWSATLAPRETARYSAEYTISHPKDLRIQRR